MKRWLERITDGKLVENWELPVVSLLRVGLAKPNEAVHPIESPAVGSKTKKREAEKPLADCML